MCRFKYINQCNAFISLYCGYLLLKSFETSSATGLLLLAITIISFAYFIFVIIKIKQPHLLRWITVVILMFMIYGLLHIVSGETRTNYLGMPIPNSDYLKKIGASMLPIYPFYYFTRKGQLTRTSIRFWLPIFIILAYLNFTQEYNDKLAHAIENGAYKIKEFTNNSGYIFVSLLPLLFIKQRNILIQFVCIGISTVFIVSSVKRGAIITGGLSILYFVYLTISQAKQSIKIKYLFFLIVFAVITGHYVSDFIINSHYFEYRLNNTLSGDSSGRDVLIHNLILGFETSDIPQMIFGHGADSTMLFTGGFLAHNDWLELLLNQGLLGIFIYTGFFIVFFTTWRQHSNNQDIAGALGSLFIILFLKTFFSMSYTEYTLYTCIAFGYCLGFIQNMKKQREFGIRP